jgi:hypothetical protein
MQQLGYWYTLCHSHDLQNPQPPTPNPQPPTPISQPQTAQSEKMALSAWREEVLLCKQERLEAEEARKAEAAALSKIRRPNRNN